MKGRELKHYELYLKSIKAYCKAIHMKLEFSELDDDGAFIPSKRMVRVSPNLPESTTIAVLLHELGHALDFVLMRPPQYRQTEAAYRNLYKIKYTRHQKTVLLTERRAWEYGKAVAKTIGIPLGQWYADTAKESIDTYRKHNG